MPMVFKFQKLLFFYFNSLFFQKYSLEDENRRLYMTIAWEPLNGAFEW